MRRSCTGGLRAMQLASALLLSLSAQAQEEEPSLDFLEYLGSWEEGDEAWYVEVQIEENGGDGTEGADEEAPQTTQVEHEDD